MGLAERRAAKDFETHRFPQLKKDLDAAAGFDVPVTVHWDTLAKTDESHLYSGERMATFDKGTLTLDHEPHTNVDDIHERSESIRKLLESKL